MEEITKLPLEARIKVLPLLAESTEKRKQYSEEFYSAEKLGVSAAKIFVELGNLDAAKNLCMRYIVPYGNFIDLIKITQMLGKTNEARKYAKKAIKNMRLHFLDIEFLQELEKLFPTEEFEKAIVPLCKRVKEKNYLFPIESFIAKRRGDEEKILELYKKSKEDIDRSYKASEKASKRGDGATVENICYHIMSLNEYHAKLCQITGNYDETIDLILYGINKQKLLDEPFVSIIDNNRQDREIIYDYIYNYAINGTYSPDFLTGAKACEKLNRKEDAEECYKRALEYFINRLYLGTAFVIAKKLNLEDIAKTYLDIVTYFYDNNHI